MKRRLSGILVFVLIVGFVLPYMPVRSGAVIVDNYSAVTDYSGLKLSVIGDSISTYEGVSNNKTYNPLYLTTSEATFGTYYGNTTHSEYSTYADVSRGDTWWQQTADTLGMELLVNNSWSGSFIVKDPALGNNTEYGVAAYKDRCVNLHIGSQNPDMIAVFLGTNDIGNYTTTKIGSKADIDTASERTALYTSLNKFATPTTSIAAYYIMISRMVEKYPNAEVYCMLPTIWQDEMASGYTNALNTFNEGVRYLVSYFAGQGKKVYLVDLDRDCGLVNDPVVRNYYYCNDVHPGLAGMDMITNCLISEIMEHSPKTQSPIHTVSYNLTNAYAKAGLPRCVVEGQSLEVSMLPYINGYEIELSVTMTDANGKTVTIPGGGVRGHSVYIPEVTGAVTVTAKSIPNNAFFWKGTTQNFAASTGIGFDYNRVKLVAGSYSNGVFNDTYYSLGRSVTLKYTQPWVVEFKGGGTFAGGILLTSKNAAAATDGNTFIHINQNYVLFGYRTSIGYNNSGISWATIASKMGSTAGANYRTETHVYRFVNVPNGTNNKIYLYVDGVKIGSMDASKLIGSSTTHASASAVNISGKDFTFNYLGTSTFFLRNFSMEYLKIFENGEKPQVEENYRWEISQSGDEFASVETQFFSDNELRQMAGSVSNGTFANTYFELDKQVVLKHDTQWNVEWVSTGDWMDARNGAMLLSGSDGHNDLNAYYLYRRNGNSFIAFGEWNSSHKNYGVNLADHGIDASARHKYTLSNEVKTDSDGVYISNMVYLYVDDVKLGAMNNYFNGSSVTGTTSDWVNGKDFTFNYLGNKGFTLGGCSLEYLQVSVACNHNYKSTIVKETCTEDGYTTHICTKCGDTYVDSIVKCVGHSWQNASCSSPRTCVICGVTDGDASGHSYTSVVTAPTCTSSGFTTYTCTVCGDTYSTQFGTASGHMWSDATCMLPKTCFICGDSEGDLADHNWKGYACTECGTTREFYLFGFINGANYGCEEDFASMGAYKFVDGVLVATFSQDSYIAVKTSNNGAWYMTQNYVTDTSATFYNTAGGASEKMFVPGGVEITFYLTVNEDDSVHISCNLNPELKLDHPSLSFEDEILYNVYYTVTGNSGITEMGLLTFANRDVNGTVANALDVIPGYVSSGSTYMVQSRGVPAKNLGDAMYFKVYAKLKDGSYIYSDIAGYHAVAYANSVLNSTASSAKAKALVVAMLNYGAAAQTYFGYKTDTLMNANLTAAQKALARSYDASMVGSVVKADPGKVGSFVMNDGYSNIYPTVSFEGAFSINYYFTPNKAVDHVLTFYYWDTATYNSVSTLTSDNATGVITMTKYGNNWGAAVENIAAKAVDKTVYVAGSYTSNGISYPTGVIAYSLGNYCKTIAANGEAFGAATAVYGYYAKAYFA